MKLIESDLREIEVVLDRIGDVERRLMEAQSEIDRLRARLARAEKEAATDSLTGIANRRGFHDLLTRSASDVDAEGVPLSLLMIDVDHFKAFNDRFGHDIGDHVLRLVAHSLFQLPDADPHRPPRPARYGGEEFAVLLEGVSGVDAYRIADRLRDDLARRQFIMRGSGEPLDRITISVGAAERVPGEDPNRVLRRADIALYDAKRRGRNRVEPTELARPRDS
jgi:diguanylate cyclase